MGSYLVNTSVDIDMGAFTVIFTQDLPLNLGVAGFHYSLIYAVDRFKAAEICIAYLGGYGVIIAVLEGHHVPVLKGPSTHVWDNKEQYNTIELPVAQIGIKQVNPAKLIPGKRRKDKKAK